MLGSVTLSIDLRRAFDSISRSHIKSSLEWAGIPANVADVILGLHHAMTIQYSAAGFCSRTATGKGVRQGCRLAPILWCCFTGWLMSRLMPLLSEREIEHLLTFFADDTLLQCEVARADQVEQVLRLIGFTLDFLEQHDLKANLDKTVILAKFVGYQHTKVWAKHTEQHQEHGLCVRIPTRSGAVLLPIKTTHKYLGVQLSYTHMARDSVLHRIKCAQSSFSRLNVALKRTSKLSLNGKIRLWQAVVHSTLRYGISSTGFDQMSLGRYRALFIRQLRAICDSPVHLTCESTEALLVRVGVDCPVQALAKATEARHRMTAQQAVFRIQPDDLADMWTQVLATVKVPGDPLPTQTAVVTVPAPDLADNSTEAPVTEPALADQDWDVVPASADRCRSASGQDELTADSNAPCATLGMCCLTAGVVTLFSVLHFSVFPPVEEQTRFMHFPIFFSCDSLTVCDAVACHYLTY